MALTARAALRHGRLRVSSLVAVAALAAGVLSACGGGGDGGSGGSADIVVAHGYTDKEATALQAAADDWNGQHPDQKVTLQFNGGNDSALQKTLAGFTARPGRGAACRCGGGRGTPAAPGRPAGR